jgi:predicted hydrolase (HD superfamily)
MKNNPLIRNAGKGFLAAIVLVFCLIPSGVTAQTESRIGAVMRLVDSRIAASAQVRKNYVHAYGVADCSTVLALKRGLSPELARVTGLLHDIHYIETGSYDRHDVLGAQRAREILRQSGLFTEDETAIVAEAILHHDDHANLHGPYDEVLKDADVLQPYLGDVTRRANPSRIDKLKRLFAELGLDWKIE